MKRQTAGFLTLFIVIAFTFSACCNRQHLEVSKSAITFSYAGGNDFFNVEADCDWTVEVDGSQSWLTVNPTEGSNNASVAVNARQNNGTHDRSTTLTVVSENGKVRRNVVVNQARVDISPVIGKVWFLRFYERWDSDYWNNVIPESYRSWTYYSDIEFENWYFYFYDDHTGYQVHTQQGDTIYHPYEYQYYPDGDSLYIAFENINSTQEDYHAIIHELTQSNFSFSDAYDWHEFEKLNLVNVSTSKRKALQVNKKKIAPKPSGPLIQVK